MKIYNEHIALQSQKRREVFNLTTQIKAALEKSGCREGFALISAPHPGSALVVAEDDPALLADLSASFAQLAPLPPENAASDSPSASELRLSGLLLPHHAALPFTEGRLDLPAPQAVLFLELEGFRPRRIVVKIVGE